VSLQKEYMLMITILIEIAMDKFWTPKFYLSNRIIDNSKVIRLSSKYLSNKVNLKV